MSDQQVVVHDAWKKDVKEDVLVVIVHIKNEIKLMYFGCESKKSFGGYTVFRNFVKNIKEYFKNLIVKACILIINDYVVVTNEYCSNLDFRKSIKKELDDLQIPYFFTSLKFIYIHYALVFGKFIVRNDSEIVFILLYGEDIIPCGLKLTQNGFKIFQNDGIMKFETKHLEELPKALLDDGRDAIVGYWNEHENEILKNFENKDLPNIKIFRIGDSENCIKTFFEIMKWMSDSSYIKFHLIPIITIDYGIGLVCGEKFYPIFQLRPDQGLLPFTRTISGIKMPFCYQDQIEQKATRNNHKLNSLSPFSRYQMTVNVDTNNFISYDVKELPDDVDILPDILKVLPHILDVQMKTFMPVIVFHQNMAFIAIHKSEKIGYVFITFPDRKISAEMFISFYEEKPRFGTHAFHIFKTHPTYVVWDLLDIISQPPGSIVPKAEWGFTIAKNEENPILLEFDSFDGTKKAATPTFFLGMVIKEAIIAIKKELSLKSRPRELMFYLLEAENEEAVKAGIEDAVAQINELVPKEKHIKCSFLKLE